MYFKPDEVEFIGQIYYDCVKFYESLCIEDNFELLSVDKSSQLQRFFYTWTHHANGCDWQVQYNAYERMFILTNEYIAIHITMYNTTTRFEYTILRTNELPNIFATLASVKPTDSFYVPAEYSAAENQLVCILLANIITYYNISLHDLCITAKTKLQNSENTYTQECIDAIMHEVLVCSERLRVMSQLNIVNNLH